MVTCSECDNDRSKIDDRSLNSPINRFRFGSRFSALECSFTVNGQVWINFVVPHIKESTGYAWKVHCYNGLTFTLVYVVRIRAM